MAKKTNGYELEIKFPDGAVKISISSQGKIPEIYPAYFAHLITEKLNSVEAEFKNKSNENSTELNELRPDKVARREEQSTVNDNSRSSNVNTGDTSEVRPGITDGQQRESSNLGEHGGSTTGAKVYGLGGQRIL